MRLGQSINLFIPARGGAFTHHIIDFAFLPSLDRPRRDIGQGRDSVVPVASVGVGDDLDAGAAAPATKNDA